MIDPSLWTDDGMADLTPRQQVLYIGLFSNADDDGRLKGSATAIRLMLPVVYGRGCTDSEVREDLDAVLRVMTKLRRYEDGGREFLYFAKYRQWQKIDHPSNSQLPAPPVGEMPVSVGETADSGNAREDSPNVRAKPLLIERNRREVKGTEQKGREARASARRNGADAPAHPAEEADDGRHSKRVTIADAAYCEELVREYASQVGGEPSARAAIEDALNRKNADSYKNQRLYLRKWMNREVGFYQEREERRHATTRNGVRPGAPGRSATANRRVPEQPDDGFLASVGL